MHPPAQLPWPHAPDGDAPPRGRWRVALHNSLHGRSVPWLWTADSLTPAASLWAGARCWTAWFRARGLTAGDRVVCALPPGPAFAMVLAAALWDDLTLAPVPPSADLHEALAAADARVAVAGAARGGPDALVAPDGAGAPGRSPAALRPAHGPPSPDVRFLLQTSGTTGARRRVALSDANVAAVLRSHLPPLGLAGGTLLSVLPWHHAFGLVLELLPALLAGAEVVRDPSGGRDARSMLRAAAAHGSTHLLAVPLTVRALAEHDEGVRLLAALRGGLVGGAPVDAALAGALAGTRLRVGYGQTEASPGIALGEPGEWRPGLLGRPLGCEVRIDDGGQLAFRGPNACLGEWSEGGLRRLDPDRWVRTGDLARAESDGTLLFVGRAAHSFKLANGRFVAAGVLEAALLAACPRVRVALCSPGAGGALRLALTCEGALPGADELAAALGPLARVPLELVAVDADAWVRTPKGELDRRWPTGRAAR